MKLPEIEDLGVDDEGADEQPDSAPDNDKPAKPEPPAAPEAEPSPEDEVKALQARIAAARKVRQAAAPSTLVLLREQAAREELAAKDATALAAAEAKFGRGNVLPVYTDRGVVIIHRPDLVSYKRFADSQTITMDLIEQLVRPLVKHPSKDEFDKITAEFPAVIGNCGVVAGELAGMRKDVIGPK